MYQQKDPWKHSAFSLHPLSGSSYNGKHIPDWYFSPILLPGWSVTLEFIAACDRVKNEAIALEKTATSMEDIFEFSIRHYYVNLLLYWLDKVDDEEGLNKHLKLFSGAKHPLDTMKIPPLQKVAMESSGEVTTYDSGLISKYMDINATVHLDTAAPGFLSTYDLGVSFFYWLRFLPLTIFGMRGSFKTVYNDNVGAVTKLHFVVDENPDSVSFLGIKNNYNEVYTLRRLEQEDPNNAMSHWVEDLWYEREEPTAAVYLPPKIMRSCSSLDDFGAVSNIEKYQLSLP